MSRTPAAHSGRSALWLIGNSVWLYQLNGLWPSLHLISHETPWSLLWLDGPRGARRTGGGRALPEKIEPNAMPAFVLPTHSRANGWRRRAWPLAP
jgi:hypothetical protein